MCCCTEVPRIARSAHPLKLLSSSCSRIVIFVDVIGVEVAGLPIAASAVHDLLLPPPRTQRGERGLISNPNPVGSGLLPVRPVFILIGFRRAGDYCRVWVGYDLTDLSQSGWTRTRLLCGSTPTSLFQVRPDSATVLRLQPVLISSATDLCPPASVHLRTLRPVAPALFFAFGVLVSALDRLLRRENDEFSSPVTSRWVLVFTSSTRMLCSNPTACFSSGVASSSDIFNLASLLRSSCVGICVYFSRRRGDRNAQRLLILREVICFFQLLNMLSKIFTENDGQLNVSFGYRCLSRKGTPCEDSDEMYTLGRETKNQMRSSFSCLSGAALSANATLANTNICNGLIGTGILPGLDSPKEFHRVPSSPSLSSLDILSSSLQSNMSNLSGCISSQSDCSEWDTSALKSMSAPSRSENFLNASEVQMAGGAAGEDRVQAVCSEENGWLFCSIYDGFNGRDAADFLASTLYENIRLCLNMLDSQMKHHSIMFLNNSDIDGSLQYFLDDSSVHEKVSYVASRFSDMEDAHLQEEEPSFDSYRRGVLCCLQQALAQAESDFLHMVEQEMDSRPDLVSIGSCVLVVLLHGQDLYTLSLGDSRALLATTEGVDVNEDLIDIQLTNCHSVDNETERMRILSDHPDDPQTIVAGKVKGKLKLTRAFGVGYLKKKKMNDALIGILRVSNLLSPPYISTQPSLSVHRISADDLFVIVASDGLFDFFSNKEAAKLVNSFILSSPLGNPAKFLVEQLVLRAATRAGFTLEELMSVPAGRRRKYHDDVTVIVILLGSDHRTSTASTLE